MSAGEPVFVPGAPAPAGHYSAGMKHGGLVYVSGQLGARADGGHTFDEPFEVQAGAALDNVFRVLDAAGCGKQDLLKVTVYLVGAGNWPLFNEVYAQAMGEAKPARAVVPVAELHYGYLVEIEAVAACPA